MCCVGVLCVVCGTYEGEVCGVRVWCVRGEGVWCLFRGGCVSYAMSFILRTYLKVCFICSQ